MERTRRVVQHQKVYSAQRSSRKKKEEFSSKKMTGSKVYCIMYYTVHCKLYSIPHSAQYTVYWIGQRFCPLTQNAIRSTRYRCHLKHVRCAFLTLEYINFFWRQMSASRIYRTIYYTVDCKLYSISHSKQYSKLASAKIQYADSTSSTEAPIPH